MQEFDSIDLFEKMTSALRDEAADVLGRAEETQSPRDIRAAFHIVFASVEGLVAFLKQSIVELPPHYAKHYSAGELALIREEMYHLDNNGDIQVSNRRLPLDLNFKFSIKMFMKEVASETKLDTESDGWRSFKEALSVRNRLTHPRQLEDLDVQSNELQTLLKAFNWCHNTVALNVFVALKGARRKEYERHDTRLGSETLSWIDTIESHLLEENASGLLDKSMLLSLDTRVLKTLVSCGIIESTRGTLVLTGHGKDYVKWRRTSGL